VLFVKCELTLNSNRETFLLYCLKGNAVGFHLKNQSVDVVSRNKCRFFMNYAKKKWAKCIDFNVERVGSYNV